jgi:hypothetical protein
MMRNALESHRAGKDTAFGLLLIFASLDQGGYKAPKIADSLPSRKIKKLREKCLQKTWTLLARKPVMTIDKGEESARC